MAAQGLAFIVHRSETRRGIPCESLDAVKAALTLFAQGGTRGSHATTTQLVADGGLAGIFAVAMKSQIESGKGNSFLESLFNEIDEGLKKRSAYSRHYDYDGMGSFFKTTVKVEKVNDKLFLLNLHAAYVGDQVEVGLAETLGIERALVGISVNVDLPMKGNQFVADLGSIFTVLRLSGALPRMESAKAVVKGLTTEKHGEAQRLVPLYDDSSLVVTAGLNDVPRAISWENGKAKMLWTIRGATITGPLRERWDDQPGFQPPQISFWMHAKGSDEFRSPRLVGDAEKNALLAIADKITAAFQ